MWLKESFRKSLLVKFWGYLKTCSSDLGKIFVYFSLGCYLTKKNSDTGSLFLGGASGFFY